MLGADANEGLREALLRDPAALTAPVSTLRDKYELLPAFLAVRGLVKQHIDSFNYLVEHDVRCPKAFRPPPAAALTARVCLVSPPRCARLCKPRRTRR